MIKWPDMDSGEGFILVRDDSCKPFFRNDENTEQIKFKDLFKINERISSRFFKILEFSRKCR